uniref:Ig-like domain-containing protein n=1 Tax=Cyprinus carpio TaxID=7962 RepID=A0A8C2K8H4_CYPCA
MMLCVGFIHLCFEKLQQALFHFSVSGLIVKGPSGPLVAPLGSSVVLPCSVDELLSAEGLKVEWRRTGSETLVHLYQDGESRTEAQQQDYQDRAHFFTDQIQHGNFSLRLENLRAEDEGQYRCTVYIQQESGETVVQIKVINVEHFIVSSSDHSTLASVGEDVTLSCSVDSHIPPEHIEEVSWKKVNEDEEEGILVLLYQDNKTLPDSSDERYKDRVELFTAEIPKGNFSLRLKSVRTEDKGVYMCQVFAGGLSANATAVLEQLGFLYETVSCCTLNILRPLMLIYAAPYLEKMSGYALFTEIFIFIVVYCSVLLSHAWERAVHHLESDKVMALVLFGVAILFFVIGFIYLLTKKKEIQYCGEICKWIWNKLAFVSGFFFLLLPSFQFAIVFFAFRDTIGGSYVSLAAHCAQVFYFLSFSCLFKLKEQNSCLELLNKIAWVIFMFIMNTGTIIYHNSILANERDGLGWICVSVFQQALWMIAIFIFMGNPRDLTITCKTIVYVFGSVVVVLLNSVTLMTELILKTVNGERALGDLRVIVFLSEGIFTYSLLFLLMFGSRVSKMKCLQCCQVSIMCIL